MRLVVVACHILLVKLPRRDLLFTPTRVRLSDRQNLSEAFASARDFNLDRLRQQTFAASATSKARVRAQHPSRNTWGSEV